MIYALGTVMAAVGAGALIGALTFVTLLVTSLILAMVTFTASPILDRFFKD
jgi:hypothetical protein